MYRRLILYSTFEFNSLEVFSLIAGDRSADTRCECVLAWVKNFATCRCHWLVPCGVHPFADSAHKIQLTRFRCVLFSRSHSHSLNPILVHSEWECLRLSGSVCKCLKFYPQVWNRFVFTHFAQHTAIRCVQCSVYKKLLNAIVMLHMICLVCACGYQRISKALNRISNHR